MREKKNPPRAGRSRYDTATALQFANLLRASTSIINYLRYVGARLETTYGANTSKIRHLRYRVSGTVSRMG